MDALFAKTLGDTALVQTRECDDPAKGKGVFALVPLDAGTVAMRDRPAAFCTSHELSALALEDPREALPVPHRTCATCSGFVGTLQSQLATLLDARKASSFPATTAKTAKATKKRAAADANTARAPPTVSALRLPNSATQPTTLRAATTKGFKGTGKTLTFCGKTCASASEHKLTSQTEPWSAFVSVLGEIPRADRRSALLAARLTSRAVAEGPGGAASEGARLLQSDYIWTLLDRDPDATRGVREALTVAWPALREALVAAHGEARVARAAATPLAGFEGEGNAPGLATFFGFAALCGAAQMNGMAVKIPSPLMRYVATTPEAGAAPAPLKPAVQWLLAERDADDARRVAAEEAAVFGGGGDDDDDDDDSDSDSDSDELDFGDEPAEIDWGHDCQFEAASVFPPARGAAVFPLASGLNHSCAPNCEVAFAEDNAVFVVATRDVALGEELTISYVDASGADDERREELRETYGFECACARCERGGKEAKKPKKPAPAAKKAAKKPAPAAKKAAKKPAPAARKAAKKPAPAAKKAAKKPAPAAKKAAKKPAPAAKPKRKAAGAAASAAKKPRTGAAKKR
jgi:hypothetical protein